MGQGTATTSAAPRSFPTPGQPSSLPVAQMDAEETDGGAGR